MIDGPRLGHVPLVEIIAGKYHRTGQEPYGTRKSKRKRKRIAVKISRSFLYFHALSIVCLSQRGTFSLGVAHDLIIIMHPPRRSLAFALSFYFDVLIDEQNISSSFNV